MFGFRRRKQVEIDVEDVLVDSTNLPSFDKYQFEGRIEKAIAKRMVVGIGLLLGLVLVVFTARLGQLQLSRGEALALRSEDNTLQVQYIIPSRGVITDRNDLVLAWNDPARKYATSSGLAHVVGYLGYPDEDEIFGLVDVDLALLRGKTGVEYLFEDELAGVKGTMFLEKDVMGEVLSESLQTLPQDGADIRLTIDTDVQSALYRKIEETARARGFKGGAAVIMDIETGELLAMVSYPEFELTNFEFDPETGERASSRVSQENNPFLNRVTHGMYTPGSIVKPIVALAALTEEVIDPKKEILSTGSIRIPHPYEEDMFTIFNDWKAHGWIDMYYALAFSSNVYFFEVGGGFEDQEGVGIEKLNEYFDWFGFGQSVGKPFLGDEAGTVPSPEWKEDNFGGEVWRLGDTYNTAIGQYGFQVTPLQVVRAIAGVASSGRLVEPTLVSGRVRAKHVPSSIKEASYGVVREGMRLAVTNGTAGALSIPDVKVAAKTGTAEVGRDNQFVNSWITGFFPYEKPRYAFALVMERGPRANLIGGSYVMKQFLEWMALYSPEYLKPAP